MSAIKDLILDALKGADHLLLVLCVMASSLGTAILYSASRYKVVLHGMPVKQAMCMCIGIVLYFVVSQFDIRVLLQKWPLVVGFCVVLQLMCRLPVIGVSVDGNHAWIRLPGIGTLQPAELNKLFFTILLAGFVELEQKKADLSSIRSVAKLVCILGFFVGMIVVVTSDVGSSLIYCFIWLFMMWAVGIKKRWFGLALGCAIPAGALVWRILPPTNHMKTRILCLLDHDLDPLGVGFQQTRSLNVIRTGGLFGQGYMKGIATQSTSSSALPVRTSDFIFTACAEELGLVGCVIVLGLLAAIVLRCLYVGVRSGSTFFSLIAVGYSGMLIAQVLLNVGMCLYVMPCIGLTLPFFSGGGTSLITMFVAMGVISGIHSRSVPTWLRDRSDIIW